MAQFIDNMADVSGEDTGAEESESEPNDDDIAFVDDSEQPASSYNARPGLSAEAEQAMLEARHIESRYAQGLVTWPTSEESENESESDAEEPPRGKKRPVFIVSSDEDESEAEQEAPRKRRRVIILSSDDEDPGRSCRRWMMPGQFLGPRHKKKC